MRIVDTSEILATRRRMNWRPVVEAARTLPEGKSIVLDLPEGALMKNFQRIAHHTMVREFGYGKFVCNRLACGKQLAITAHAAAAVEPDQFAG